MIKKNDILLILILFLGASAWWGTSWWLGRGEAASQVQIWQNKVLVGTYPLHGEAPVNIPLGSSLGYNTLVIETGAVHMTAASCPDQVCVHTGPISKPGQTIVCLPNRVVVEITGETEGQIDDISQ